MACDYDRQLIYYTIFSDGEETSQIGRMNKYGGDMKIIFDKGDVITFAIGVYQETGNLYYNTGEGIGFLSYTQNYSKTIFSTTPETKDVVYDFGFHGKGTNKRVYWSTWTNLYRSQPGTSKPITLGLRCHHFIILNQGMVCQSMKSGLYLANLDGVKTESLPNIAIASSKLVDFGCVGSISEGVITAGGIIYILCSSPNRLYKLSVTNNAVRGLVLEQQPGLPREKWFQVCVWHQEKSVMSPQTGTSISNSTIFMVVGIVAGILLMLAIKAVLIRKCVKNKQKKTIDKNPNETLDDSVIYDEIMDNTTVRNQYESIAYVSIEEPSH
ncbi:uncharacterized protein LOC126824743 isoform X2 [Patella vulgata]|uniref:uncharacterized protein LOC126824743 isoform X2 n=1 Tax=Patella vulgata TaxID=6465 RepID=UPI00217F6968|nr:uncharacterized protein LOC126824743 isoform X2 [Patella vulgata]